MADETLPKSERLCGATAVADLFEHGKGVTEGCFRCKYLVRADDGPSRLVVSVPKRHFKRAVKRNLLKRRMREAYRTQKHLLGGVGPLDLMLVYNSKEVLDYQIVRESLAEILHSLSANSEKPEAR